MISGEMGWRENPNSHISGRLILSPPSFLTPLSRMATQGGEKGKMEEEDKGRMAREEREREDGSSIPRMHY